MMAPNNAATVGRNQSHAELSRVQTHNQSQNVTALFSDARGVLEGKPLS